MSLFNFSKKSDYGFLFLSKLTLSHINDTRERVSISSFAKENNLPIKFMEQIAVSLKKGNIVKSIEGRNGGYILSRNPSEISMFEVLSILEGKVIHTVCMDELGTCKYSKNCSMKNIWKGIGGEIEEILKAKTLAQINIK